MYETDECLGNEVFKALVSLGKVYVGISVGGAPTHQT